MSVLETFYILFKSNSKDLKKDADEVKKSSNEINTSLQSVSTNANKVGDSFVGLGKSLAGVFAGIVSVQAIVSNISAAYEHAVALNQTSKALNVNIETLDAWGQAVQRQGGTAQGFQSSIESLAKTLNIRNQDAIRLLPMLADSFKAAGTDRSQRFGKNLGLDQATIMTLQQGRREVEAVIARQKELGVVTQRDAEIAQVFKTKWLDMSQAMTVMWVQVGSTILPILGELLDKATSFYVYLQEHSDLVVGVFNAIGIAIAVVAAGLIAANIGVTAIAVGIGLVIAAFALVFEDIRAFMKGNDSLIGDMLSGWPKVAEVLRNVFYGAMHPLQSFQALARDVFGFIHKGLNVIMNSIGRFRNFVLRRKAEQNDPEVEEVLAIAQEQIAHTRNVPLLTQTSSNIFNGGGAKTISVNTGPITINTQATNGDEVSASFTKSLIDHFTQATGTFDDGVVA